MPLSCHRSLVSLSCVSCQVSGGERTRTADFYVANVALYQLSYTPGGRIRIALGTDQGVSPDQPPPFGLTSVEDPAALLRRRCRSDLRWWGVAVLTRIQHALSHVDFGCLRGCAGEQCRGIDGHRGMISETVPHPRTRFDPRQPTKHGGEEARCVRGMRPSFTIGTTTT